MRMLSSIVLSAYVGSAIAVAPVTDLRELLEGQSGAFARAVQAGAGFSFQYGAHNVGPVLDKDWQTAVTRDAKVETIRTVFTHRSGLVVTRETHLLGHSGAIEYQLHFRNASGKALVPISRVKSLDIGFDQTVADGTCVVSSAGGFQDSYLPPRNYTLRRSCLAPGEPSASGFELSTEGGRSSDKDLPFFLVHNEARQAGVYVALGWTGEWRALVLAHGASAPLQLMGGMPQLDVKLEPGEEIAGPTVLIGPYQGSSFDGANRLRRLIRDVYTPKLNGRTMLPVATFNTAYAVGFDFDEVLLKHLADAAAALGQEYFLLDAGWHEGEDWSQTMGNWDAVNRQKLPHGLAPVGQYVRSKGLQLGLWFDLERVSGGSHLALAHPDWVLWDYGKGPAPWYQHVPGVPYFAGNNADPDKPEVVGLLDLGRPEAQQYVEAVLEHYIRDEGVKYIRYDFNLDPLPYWRAADKPGRRGMTQLRHVQGLYAVLDFVRERYPDVIIETCDSGGNRIDLETVRRSHTLWIDDQSVNPAIVRYHLFGINAFLPGNYHYILYTQPNAMQVELPKDFHPDDLGFQSLFGGAMGIGAPAHLWSESMKAQALRQVQTWKQLRRYLIEDYYPLSPQPADMASWSGWQFHDPKDQSGFIQTFRTHTPDSKHQFFPKGLDSTARYRFEDVYNKESFELTGAAAVAEGIEFTQAPMSSRVLTYRKEIDLRTSMKPRTFWASP